ncbi:MAG TPA: tetratricopeptide repeat protein [Bacteroidales bacterium]|nr:tetratricopeptide repeat protein [Bacteroidales bacterium]
MKRNLLILAILLYGISCFGQASDKQIKDGLLKCRLRDYRGAVTIFNQAIKNNPANPDAFYYRGIAKSELRDYKSAIADFTKAIELNPGKVDAFYERGMARKRLGDYSGARADFARAKEIKPNSSSSDYRDGHRPSFTLKDTASYKSMRNMTREKFLIKFSAPDSVDVFDKRGFDLYSLFYFHDTDTCWIFFNDNALQSIMYVHRNKNWRVIEY